MKYSADSAFAAEFINEEEIRATIAYASSHKNDASLIDEILAKAGLGKGLSHREAAVLLECESHEQWDKIFALARRRSMVTAS